MLRLKLVVVSMLFLTQIILPASALETNFLAQECLATPNSNGCRAGLPATQYQMLLDEMLFYDSPNIEQLPSNEEEIYRFAFRKLSNPNGIPVYNAPNGDIIETISNNTTHATTQGYEPGWVMIAPGRWVREGDTEIAQPSTFAGVLLNNDSLIYPLAWVLLPEYPAPYPGAQGDLSRSRIERYTPVHIFAEMEIDGWLWYLVGPDTWIIQTSIGKVVPVQRPEGVKGPWIAADLYEQVLVVYDEDDIPIYATLMSSGETQYPTNEGIFQTWQRMNADAMTGAIGRTDFYDIDYVPWVLYFDNNIAIHGVFWHDKFGYRASRGCLGLSLTDARWVFGWTSERGYDQPFVYVFSSGQY